MYGDKTFTDEERERYSRQLILPGIGSGGQARLRNSRVLIVGAGGLGSPAAMYLAAAGVGVLGILDADTVDRSNIQRQILHGSDDVGRLKTLSAGETLSGINPNVEIVLRDLLLTMDTVREAVSGYDAVLGCVDNFDARYAINAACVDLRIPNIYGSVSMFEGQASVFPPGGPCYRCFFRDPPPPGWSPEPGEKGILGVVPGIIGCIQATETLKTLLGIGKTLAGRLVLLDALSMSFREIMVKKDPDCPACGEREGRQA